MEKERDRRQAQQPDPSELEDWGENRILYLVIGTGVGGVCSCEDELLKEKMPTRSKKVAQNPEQSANLSSRCHHKEFYP